MRETSIFSSGRMLHKDYNRKGSVAKKKKKKERKRKKLVTSLKRVGT
jgi:hypothetical protein